jgi:hypothetical protein
MEVGKESKYMDLRTLLFAALIWQPLAYAAAESSSLDGHYFLHGAMEMGAELLLRKDGTFAGGITYGSADGIAKGTWHVEGSTLTLKADTLPDKTEDNLGVLFDDLQLAIEPDCLAVDLGSGKACFRRR